MLKFGARYDNYAYRVTLPIDESVPVFEEGSWVTIKSGKITLADDTAKKAWLLTGSKRIGRNQVAGKPLHKLAFLHGSFYGLQTNKFDAAQTYSDDITELTLTANGIVTPATDGKKVFAYAIGKPENGFLTICSL